MTARAVAQGSGINRNTAILFYHELREVIFYALVAEASVLVAGEIVFDVSYIGGLRKLKRGCGPASTVPEFGLLKWQGKIYVATIEASLPACLV